MDERRKELTKIHQPLGDETLRALLGEEKIDYARVREEVELLDPEDKKRITEALNKIGVFGVTREQITPTEPPEPSPPPKPKEVELDEYGCRIGEEEWNADLNQCVKITKPTLTREQIPAQPVVPVGPVTIEQKVAALNDKIAEIEKLLANLYGLTGHSIEEIKTATMWKLGKGQ